MSQQVLKVRHDCLQDISHWPLDVGNVLSDWGELGAVAGPQLPAAMELLSRIHNIASPAKKGQSVSLEKPNVDCRSIY